MSRTVGMYGLMGAVMAIGLGCASSYRHARPRGYRDHDAQMRAYELHLEELRHVQHIRDWEDHHRRLRGFKRQETLKRNMERATRTERRRKLINRGKSRVKGLS